LIGEACKKKKGKNLRKEVSEMEKYVIRPLLQSYITAPLGVAYLMGDMRTYVTTGVYIWYLEGGDKKILIDTGMEAPGSNGLVHGFPAKGGGETGTRDALSSIGLKPEDIDILILTHLHFDHTATAHLFHNAKIYVQKIEWETAFNPPPHMRGTYDLKYIMPLENMDLALVNGDVEIEGNLKLVLLPGHTKGLQGVAVPTSHGTFLIASDHFYTYPNINPPKELYTMKDLAGNSIQLPPSPLPFIPPGLHVDLSEWFSSSLKALSITKRKMIIPGHDPTLVNKTFP
jgi:glyoxylase-like metal-dependent hydrolase (beta-lactamase superfamily II)